MELLPCIPGIGPGGDWACAVCGQPGEADCQPGPHLSTDPADWYQPEVVRETLADLGTNL